MKKSRINIVVGLILGVLIGSAFTFYSLYKKEQGDPVVYNSSKAEVRDIVKKSVATGSVVPRKEIEIKPMISGIIDELYVEAGTLIKKDTPIAKVRIIPNITSLSNAESRVKRADLSMKNAQLDYDRNKNLLEQGVLAPATFQQVELTVNNAIEELAAAKDNLQIVKRGVSGRSANATNTMVKSTMDGMILSVPVEEGNSVIESNNFNDGTTISTVANMRDLIFLGQIDESEVEKLKLDMELIVSIGAIEGKEYLAKLEYISPKGVEDNGAIQFEIKAAIQLSEEDFIRAGYSANADIVLSKKENVLSLSESLIQYGRDQKPFVEVKTGENSWEKRDVELGLSNGMHVEIVSGVSDSDEIKIWAMAGGGKGKKWN